MIDLLIVTALTEEAQVVNAVLEQVAELIDANGRLRTYRYPAKAEVTHQIAAVSAHEMGAVGMGVFSAQLFAQTRPCSAALVGIAAAVDVDAVELGDVPFASQVLSYDDIAVEKGILTFRNQGFQVDPAMRAAVGSLRTSIASYGAWQSECREMIDKVVSALNQLRRRPITKPQLERSPHIVVEVVAGGPFLLRDSDFRDALRQPDVPAHNGIHVSFPIHPRLVSAEMEAHGFMRAAHESGVPAIVLKGISDTGDAEKAMLEKKTGGFFRAYACSNAVLAALHVLRARAALGARVRHSPADLEREIPRSATVEAIERIGAIDARELVVFFGEGLSRDPPACAPGALELVEKLLCILDSSGRHHREIRSSLVRRPVSPERILAVIDDATGGKVADFLSAFDHRPPGDPRSFNGNHVSLVALAERGAALVTTNRDLFIEEAADARSVVLRRAILNGDASAPWNYLKLAGSLDARPSVAASVELAGRLSGWARAALAELGSRRHFLVCGPSGRDAAFLQVIKLLPAEHVIWYEPNGRPVEPCILEMLNGSHRPQLVEGDGGYDRLFVDLLGLQAAASPVRNHTLTWQSELKRTVQALTSPYERARALASAFAASWNGAVGRFVLRDRLAQTTAREWQQELTLRLDLAKACHRIPDHRGQANELMRALRILGTHRADAEYSLYLCQWLLQAIEYRQTQDMSSEIKKAYRLLLRAQLAQAAIPAELRQSREAKLCSRLILYYGGEVGLKYGIVERDGNVVAAARVAVEELINSGVTDLELLVDAQIILAKILLAQKDSEAALSNATAALSMASDIVKPHSINHACKLAARILIREGRKDEAQGYLARAYRVSHDECDDLELRMRDCLSWYLFHRRFGDVAQADEYLMKARHHWYNSRPGDPGTVDCGFAEYVAMLERTYD